MVSYCTNIHPGESWQQIFAAVRGNAPLVKRRLSPEHPFPLGLRLSGKAAGELHYGLAMDFLRWCREQDLYVASINGFPYGPFHGTPVKEYVYQPDWRHAERPGYTKKLAELLALWLPEGMTGSISTVPVVFGKQLSAEDMATVRAHLVDTLDHLDCLAWKTGKEILLSMEPEPGCLVETMAETVKLFERLELSPRHRSHLAVCYDCCHQALQFEDPRGSLALLEANDIRIGHVQVSSALCLRGAEIGTLREFVEPCYLHQSVARTREGELLRYNDLDLAIADSPSNVEEWRVHFHVPVFIETMRQCNSTRFFLEDILPLFPAETRMEVETYTWTILPAEMRGGNVIDCLAGEIRWVEKILQTAGKAARSKRDTTNEIQQARSSVIQYARWCRRRHL